VLVRAEPNEPLRLPSMRATKERLPGPSPQLVLGCACRGPNCWRQLDGPQTPRPAKSRSVRLARSPGARGGRNAAGRLALAVRKRALARHACSVRLHCGETSRSSLLADPSSRLDVPPAMSQSVPNPLPGLPLVESPFFDQFFERGGVDPLVQKLARDLRDNGYAIFDFPHANFGALADQVIRELGPQFDLAAWRAKKRADQTGGLRAQDAISCSAVREIATNANVRNLLEALIGRRPFPFQTLTFPVGTEQHFHTDAIHFSSMPERFMVGVWVALEDIGPDQGPLYYFPGSHKLPIYQNEHYGLRFEHGDIPFQQATYEPTWRQLVQTLGLKEAVFTPKKGQALIWLSNLFHGGKFHKDTSKTRWSQVTHYYFDDCAYYTPMHTHFPSGVVMYREPLDILTGARRKNSLCGKPVSEVVIQRATPQLETVDAAHLPPGFNAERYLELNPDVKAGNWNAVHHYLSYGRFENRRIR